MTQGHPSGNNAKLKEFSYHTDNRGKMSKF